MRVSTGHGWLTSDVKLQRLMQLSVTPEQRQQVEQYLTTWSRLPWEIRYQPPIGNTGSQVYIAQYRETSIKSAKEKLLQFPSGSRFHWVTDGLQKGEQEAFTEVVGFAAVQGILIER